MPGFKMTTEADRILREWLDGEFRHACVNDRMRLKESAWMLKIGIDRGDSIEEVMAAAIASFVKGLILKECPITVPPENN